jgi:hypothetical protein
MGRRQYKPDSAPNAFHGATVAQLVAKAAK